MYRATKHKKHQFQDYKLKAKTRLSKFRQISSLAVASTAFLLFITDTDAAESDSDSNLNLEAAQSLSEARGALENLLTDFLSFLPKLSIAIALLLLSWLLFKVFKLVYGRIPTSKQKREGVLTLARLLMIFLGLILALTVLAGDVRALIGSLGLIGLALSWTLQQPIESFSGYLLNTFRSYYHVGDRINVGEVYGDVYKIDFLTTTVWEAGAPGKSVSGAQPTGALITFPNSEVVRSNIVNYSRDFPFIWDEVTISVSNESNLAYTSQLVRRITEELIGDSMKTSAQHYQSLLRKTGLEYDISEVPQVFLSAGNSWTDCTVRYLVELRKRRHWASLIFEKLSEELGKNEHQHQLTPAYPKSIVVAQPPDPKN